MGFITDTRLYEVIKEQEEAERKAKIRAQFFETVHGELIRLNAIDCLGNERLTEDYKVILRGGEFVYLNKQDGERLKRALLGEDEQHENK